MTPCGRPVSRQGGDSERQHGCLPKVKTSSCFPRIESALSIWASVAAWELLRALGLRCGLGECVSLLVVTQIQGVRPRGAGWAVASQDRNIWVPHHVDHRGPLWYLLYHATSSPHPQAFHLGVSLGLVPHFVEVTCELAWLSSHRGVGDVTETDSWSLMTQVAAGDHTPSWHL